MDAHFEITTALAASARQVWEGAIDPDGINHELGPLISMTVPKGLPPGTTIQDVELAVPLGRSWIRFAGIPIDYDDLCLAERGPGYRFLERSKLGSARMWEHEREVTGMGAASCEITDRVAIELRAPLRALGGARLAPRVMRTLFAHRHKRLVERWGRA